MWHNDVEALRGDSEAEAAHVGYRSWADNLDEHAPCCELVEALELRLVLRQTGTDQEDALV